MNRLRFLAPLLGLSLLLALSACGDDEPSQSNNGDTDMGMDTGSNNGTGDMANNGTDDMDPDMPDMGDDDVVRVACGAAPVPSSDGSPCEATAGSNGSVIIHGASILTPEAIYQNGYVIYEEASGEITCTGCDCATDPSAAGATVISCANGVVSPSLINPHEHITFSLANPSDWGDERYDHRNDWRLAERGHTRVTRDIGSDSSREALLFVELRHLLAGTTSIAGSGSTADLLRNLDRAADTGGLQGVDVQLATFPVGSSGFRTTDCSYSQLPSESVLSAPMYAPHVSEGIDLEAQNEYRCISDASAGIDVVEGNTSIIHGVGLTTRDVADMAASGANLIWSPRSNISLYGMTARLALFKSYGVPIALGTDWSASGSAELLRELKCADSYNRDYLNNLLTDRELWQSVTDIAALSMGAETQIGSLETGMLADIAIFDGALRSEFRAVIDASAGDVVLVLRGGTPLVGESDLIEALVPAGEIDGCEDFPVCNRPRKLCLGRDTAENFTYDQIRGAIDQNSYGPFFCDTPATEPTCIPTRMGEFDGIMSATDNDGDGLDNGTDMCVDVFTPIRPVEGAQGDTDGDGIGDDCDVCPLTAGETCTPFDPNDRDGDTIPNDIDNCPTIPNKDQSDRDNDGIGDVCDACPDFDNTNAPYCPATVYEVRDGTYVVGDIVMLTDVIVTADNGDGTNFFQVDPNAASYTVPEGSGMQLYRTNATGTIPAVAVGDRITLIGTVDSYSDALQIGRVSSLTVDSSGNAAPLFQDVDPSLIATGGAKVADLQGVLVRVQNVTVTNNNPDAPDDYAEFAVDSGLRVDDFIYTITPRPTLNDAFSSLSGILHYSFGNSKLLPRGDFDYATGPPVLIELAPAEAYLEIGATGVPVPNLEVRLSSAPTVDTTVALTYSGDISGPATVDVLNGQTSAQISITAGATNAGGTVSADLDGTMFSTTIVTYDDTTIRTVAGLSPDAQNLTINDVLDMTVTLNVPAGSSGQLVDLVFAPGTQLSGPAAVTVPAGAVSVTFQATAGTLAGVEDVTASIGTSSQQVSVNVIEPPANCLIISEYIEGSGSNNKAIELYNCSGVDLELDGFGVCLISNDATNCSTTMKMATKTLSSANVHTLCRNKSAADPDPVTGISSVCEEVNASVMNFNGDDRLIVFQDVDGSGSYEAANDVIVDALGELPVNPPTDPWKDVTLRRCNFTPHLGGPFTTADFYTSHPRNDASDYGIAPIEGCP